jgi:peptidoglycan/xylan/chitin deacetylase (PgdA/CDA1 family)
MKKILRHILHAVHNFLPERGVVILMYHSVGENKEYFSVTPLAFEQQMKHLATQGFNVISTTELVGILENRLPIPPRTVAITFDDGYKDNYVDAFPVLKRYKLPATIFINTERVGQDVVARNGSRLEILNIEMIKEMRASGVLTFGSHSHRHIKLGKLSEGEVVSELTTSRNILSEILGTPVSEVAYPFGSCSKLVCSVASSLFRVGYGVSKGVVTHGADMFNLRRNSIDSEVSFFEFKGIVRHGRV